MAFSGTDFYLTSGTNTGYNSWVPYVTKFDTSTFYNWEQDNQPLYDLEDRTNLLWDRVGNPVQDGFSAISGRMFAVSADAPFAGESSGIIHKSLSSVINILPNPITYPIIIEVASFGSLGELNLNNIKIDQSCPGAGLEIINRNFARTTYTTTASALWNTSCVSSLDLANTLHNSSAICISATVASASTGEARWESNNRLWVVQQAYNTDSHISDRPILSLGATSFDQTLGSGKLAINEYTATQDPSITAYDISVTHSVTGGALARPALSSGERVTALIYGNYLKKVSVNGCNGPIYIRNFCVDGASGTGATLLHNTNNGFDIQNSNIVVDNCMAMRCQLAGFNIENSVLEVRRGIVATRNYYLSSTSSARDTRFPGVGIKAINSHVKLSTYAVYAGVNQVFQTAFNDIGLQLINSRISEGGRQTVANISGEVSYIQAMYNNVVGIDIQNSVYEHLGRTEVYNNAIGFRANSSKVNLPAFTAEYNANEALLAEGSVIKYNPDLYRYVAGSRYANATQQYQQFHFYINGQDIKLNRSVFEPTLSPSNMPSKYGLFSCYYSMGSKDRDGNKVQLPTIEVNDSTLELVHPTIWTAQDISEFGYMDAIFGAAICSKNSSVKLKGSGYGPTYVIGPNFYSGQKKTALVYGNKGSIEFNGNTLLGQTGVNVLVENGAEVKFSPHKNPSNSLDVSGWALSSVDNHTRVELQSTRACLVANKGTITMEDIGDYTAFWPSSVTSSCDYNLNNVMDLAAYTSGGYIQFYPNGQDSTTIAASSNRYDITSNLTSIYYVESSRRYFLTDYTVGTIKDDILKFSTGGMCVRALEGSKVKVKNVHFPTGWYNTSGTFYDVSSETCSQLRIWNIGDDSDMHASYMTVSGVYPSLVGYTGPSAVYVSGAGVIASGAPNSTPDTSSLSVLDLFGALNGASGTNLGPFRLYFSPITKAKMLGYVSGAGALYGPPYQVLAQGYNPSGNLTGNGAFSGVYSGITASSFYYVSAMVNPTATVRLDESAANTFANAKHNANPKSGRVALVTIYRAEDTTGGEASDTNLAGYGDGLLSASIFDLTRDN